MFIDIGGTPANILKNKKPEIALSNKIPKEKLVAIMDPFDLSRAERIYYEKNKKIKVKINVKDVNLSSDCTPEFNLREFMNKKVKEKYPWLKTIKLEEVLKNNQEITRRLMKKFDIPVRVICPKCKKFSKSILGKGLICCDISANKIINSGRYIPQSGFLTAITYLCGYQTYSNDKIKIKQTKEIMEKLEIKGNPILTYKEKLIKQRKTK